MNTAAHLNLIAPGLYTLIVDQGRARTRSLGVSVGGAADRYALALGNGLVGNPPDMAALEIALAGPTVTTDASLACVVWGAPFEMDLDGRNLPTGTTFTLEAGQRLRIGGTPAGARAYLCVHGGIDAPVILGSRSSLAPLGAGTVLSCRRSRIRGISVRGPDTGWKESGRYTLRVLPGGQADWFEVEPNPPSPPSLRGKGGRNVCLPPLRFGGEGFCKSPFTVTAASNRMGIRLAGEPLPVPAREMVSEPVCPGTVQVTRDGQCIILGVDGQTIGGYPRIAQVISADLDLLGQFRPGDEIDFAYVTLEEAERLGRHRQAQLCEWRTRLEVSVMDRLW